MKKIISTILLLVLVFSVSGCKSELPDEKSVLKVISHDYQGLTEIYAAEIDEEVVKDWNLISINPYYDYICHVSLRNNELYISSECEYPNSFSVMGNYGYFVGVDMGEYAGWVNYYSYGNDDPILVANEKCRGFVNVNKETAYLFTGSSISEATGAMYQLSFTRTYDENSCTKVAELSGYPLVYTYNESAQVVYVATTMSLQDISLVDFEVVTLADLSLWKHSGATSIVEHDGMLYVGMCMGIYEYNLDTKEVHWYPMEYEKYIDNH